jgi:hypothetical protein
MEHGAETQVQRYAKLPQDRLQITVLFNVVQFSVILSADLEARQPEAAAATEFNSRPGPQHASSNRESSTTKFKHSKNSPPASSGCFFTDLAVHECRDVSISTSRSTDPRNLMIDAVESCYISLEASRREDTPFRRVSVCFSMLRLKPL